MIKYMTSQEKKEYLKKYDNTMLEVESLTMRRDKLYSISGQTLSFTSSANKGKDFDRLTDYLSDLIAQETKFHETESERSKLINKSILDAISNLTNSIERKVLTLKYIYGLKWEIVFDVMKYSRTQTLRYHGEALKHLAIDCIDEKELEGVE